MVQKALHFTSLALDSFLKKQFGIDESSVELNNMIDSDGTVPPKNENKVILSLINIEKETNKPYYQRNEKGTNGQFTVKPPAERYNLYLLLTPNFDDYSESLKFLNEVILFFQQNPSFNSSSSPLFPSELYKLDFNIENMNYREMHNLWTSIGAKYQPSVMYKSRLIKIDSNEIKGFKPEVKNIQNSAQN